jgi:hypothetical protein
MFSAAIIGDLAGSDPCDIDVRLKRRVVDPMVMAVRAFQQLGRRGVGRHRLASNRVGFFQYVDDLLVLDARETFIELPD